MMLRVLVLIICGVQAASAVTHTLIHDGTVSSHSPDITVRAKLDDEEIGYYDSDKGATPEQDWVKEEKYWDMSIRSAVPVLKTCKDAVRPEAEIRQQFGCGQSDDGKTSSFWNMTYKGQDFTLDRDSWSWTSEGRIPSDLPPEPNRRRAEQVLDQVCPECLKTLTRRRRAAVDNGEVAYQRSHSPVTHSLRYFYTGVGGVSGFPEFTIVGLVDGQEFVHYDSDIKRMIPKTEWIERNEGKDYWDTETQNMIGETQTFKANIQTAMQRFNQTGGVHTNQRMYGCEWDEETGATEGFEQHGYDGRDWLVFDLKTLTWTAPVPQAFQTKQKWDADRAFNEGNKNYLTQECIEWLKKYVNYGRETLNRRERPQVSVFHKDSRSGSTELTCLATGFFPRDIVVSWWRDGQELHEDVDSGEVLPNGDGSFQVRKSLRVRAGEEDKYSCRVDHSSSPGEDIVRTWEPKGGFPIGIIVGVVVGVLVLIAVVGIVIWRKRQTGYGKASTSDSDSNSSNNPPAKA